jgi:hypothetical protein
MDSHEKVVIIARGLCLLSEEEKREKPKYWIHNVLREREGEEEFHTLF